MPPPLKFDPIPPGLTPANWPTSLPWPRQWLTKPQQELVRDNMPLVDYVLSKEPWLADADNDDAKSVGFLGLMRAAKGFRPEKGFQFSTYAVHAIRREIQRFTRMDRLISVPNYQFDRRGRGHKFHVEAIRATRIVHPDGDVEPWSNIVARDDDEPPRLESDQLKAIRRTIRRLPARWRMVIRGRLKGRTLKEIGRELGITRERVRQIEQQAHERLRDLLETAGVGC